MRTIGTFQIVARHHGYITVIATTENNPSHEDEAIIETFRAAVAQSERELHIEKIWG